MRAGSELSSQYAPQTPVPITSSGSVPGDTDDRSGALGHSPDRSFHAGASRVAESETSREAALQNGSEFPASFCGQTLAFRVEVVGPWMTKPNFLTYTGQAPAAPLPIGALMCSPGNIPDNLGIKMTTVDCGLQPTGKTGKPMSLLI